MEDRRKNSLICKLFGHKKNNGYYEEEDGWSEIYRVYLFCGRCNRYITFKLQYPHSSYRQIRGMREMDKDEKLEFDKAISKKKKYKEKWYRAIDIHNAILVALVIFTVLMVGFVFFFRFVTPAGAESPLPEYKNYVNDFTEKTVSQEFLDKENAKLKAYDEKTSNQIAVAIIDTTKPLTIEEYSIKLAEKWKPGTEKKDNGILMTFAMNDRKMRIEVGYGLEGDVTDLESKIIIDDHITPLFKEKRYEEGIDAGIDQLILSIATDSAALAQQDGNLPPEAIVVLIIVGIIILIVILVAIADSPYTPLGGSGSWGISTGWGSSDSSDSDGFGGFGGGSFGGGGASGGW